MSITSQFEQINSTFDEQTAAVKEDANLSQTGKQAKLDAISTERTRALDNLAVMMRKEAATAALRVDTLGRLRAFVSERNTTWDYNRLAYESKAVESAVTLAGGDFDQLAAAFKKVTEKGDKHAVKAWRDVAPGLLPRETRENQFGIPEDYTNPAKQALLDAFQDAAVIVQTDEENSLQAEEEERRGYLAELRGVAADMDAQNGERPYIEKQIFDGIAGAGAEKMTDADANETPQDFLARREEKNELSPAEKAMAAKLGVSETNYMLFK
ncbi:MAG: hypothetical protein GY862_30340 [Gammaproteobacteria bacterium]|nr:hypothetical protein [Gammaproteobacteria bacterium]